MSEHSADFTPDANGDRAGNRHIDSPNLAPGQGDGFRAGGRKEAPKLGAPGRISLMGPTLDGAQRDEQKRERSWEDMVNAEPRIEHEQKNGTTRMIAIAAMIAIGITVGAVGGTMAMSGLGKLLASDDGKSTTLALEDHINRLESEVAALKADADKANKATAAARAKFNDRLDKLEKAQAEPNAKIAKLNEAVEKLRTAPPPAPVAAAPAPTPAPVAAVPAKEVTGSINNAPTPAPKPDVARLPTVDGWRIVDVAAGGATIEGRQGVFEVYPGDPVPGLGRVDAVRKQDGKWTVVTSRGLIVGR